MSSNIQFSEFVEYVEARLDETVEQGSDQELFVAGYLHGHFSLVVSQVELMGDLCITKLDEALQKSLQDAFAQNELEEEDQGQVYRMWQKIFSNT